MAEPNPLPWRQVLRARLLVAGVCVIIWAVAIEARLLHLQVVRHTELLARAERQQMMTVIAAGKRGDIRDRNNHLLAYSVDVDTIYSVPTEVDDPAKTAQALCRALDECDGNKLKAITQRLSRKNSPFAYVERQVSEKVAARVKALDLPGVGFMKESRRYYPKRELAAQVLGYVGIENEGLGGIEAAYNKLVRGRDGKVLVETDARRRGFARVDRSPTAGATLELTLDQQLQYIVERELKKGVTAHRAEGGTAILMDPHTGEILAMATYPSFNPNTFRAAAEAVRKNRAVTDLYEPGSTFKIVTASAAIQEGVVAPTDMIDVSAGMIKFAGRPPIEDVFRYGVLSFADVIAKSSNVGAIKVGLKLGPERLGMYVNRFGFGKTSSPDFPGESPGIVWDPSRLNDSALASISMGYQVGVTPLQMVAAASVVANGGRLVQPHVVRATIKDGIREAVVPADRGRPITARTAAELTSIMEDVVTHGTGTQARIDGFTVAGKSGTAGKLVAGRYSKSEYNVSFVGFAPSRQPVLTGIVVIDTPRAGKYYGGSVAAPIFHDIVDASLRHLGVAPTVFPAPPVLVDRKAQLTDGPGPTVIRMNVVDDGRGMPDLRGLGAREALRRLSERRMTARLQGSGVVVAQSPAPGEVIDGSNAATLVLHRNPRRLAQAMLAGEP